MLPKMGKELPKSISDQYADTISAALRIELGASHQAVKRLMRWTGASERTAKNWLSGTCGPSGVHLVSLMNRSDNVVDCVLALAGRRPALRMEQIVRTREGLALILDQIDEVLRTALK
jgi:hypothetical protein